MLTPNQQLIANHTEGHSKVLASAGSGKTTTLVSRVQNLVASGVPHYQIISVMFNRDARDSYKDKLVRVYGKDKCPPVFTFHGLGTIILNKLIEQGKLPKAKLETSDWKLTKMAMEVLDEWIGREPSKRMIAAEFISFVDLCKNSLGSPAAVFKEYDMPGKHSFFVDGFRLFEAARKKQRLRTFGDLIYEPVKFLMDNKDEVAQFANKYKHVIVDEFQDISDIQMEMVRIVAGQRASVMVVGDDDQCIYTWRGARPDYLIAGFDAVFKNAKTFYLDQTFRYGNQVAMAASYLIKNNTKRAPKLCVSAPNTPKTKIILDTEVVGQPSVPKQVASWVQSGRKLSEIAVLVRSYSLAIPVEIALLQTGIPYRVEGGTPIFESFDIGALMAGLYQASGEFKNFKPADKLKFARAYILHPSLGLEFSYEQELTRELAANPSDPAAILDAFTYRLQAQWQKDRLIKRAAAWRNLAAMRGRSPRDVVDYIVDMTGVKHHIQYTAKSPEEAEDAWRRYEAIYQYADHIGQDLGGFVAHIEDLRKGYKADDSGGDALAITSVHRSKGLEWPFVIMPGLSQGKFPLISPGKNTDIEDERRLFYVGITRAQERLVLICPKDNRLAKFLGHGADKPPEKLEASPATASQFIYESNLFLSQMADKLVAGTERLPAQIAAPDSAKQYIEHARKRTH